MSATNLIAINSGNNQLGTQGLPFPLPLTVLATNNSNPTAGIIVIFSDGGAGGTFSNNPATSGADGLASTLYTPPAAASGPYVISFTNPPNGFYVVTPLNSRFTENAAVNSNGQTITVNAQCSIKAKVVSVSGHGINAIVTVQAPLDAGTFVIYAHDAYAVEQLADNDHAASSIVGKPYGKVGDDVTVMGRIVSITGLGVNAVATVLLITSQTTIQTAAGNCVTT